MGRMGGTKKQILSMLQTKQKTLTDISNELQLAPSTVSQHLKELVDTGEIRLVEDQPRKWKYYEINRGAAYSPYDRRFPVRNIVIPIAVILLIAVVAIGLFSAGGSGVANAQQVYIAPGSAVPQGSTVFTLSDSPQFYNISAIFVTVTNVSVRADSGKWYRLPLQEHTFNLVQLKNISEIMSGVNLSAGSYDAISFSASNVTAIVNGTSRPVFLPNGKLTVLGGFNISPSSTNWVNIDLNLEKSIHITGNGTLVIFPVLVVSRQTSNDIDLNSSSIIVARGPSQSHEVIHCGMDENGSLDSNFSMPQNMNIGFRGGRPMELGRGNDTFVLRYRGRMIVGDDARAFMMNNSLNGSAVNGTFWINGSGPMPMPFIGVNANESGWQNESGWSNGAVNGSTSATFPPVRPCFSCAGIRGGQGFRPNSSWGNGSAEANYTGGEWIRLPPGLIGDNASGYAHCKFDRGEMDCDENESVNATLGVGVNQGGPIWQSLPIAQR